MSVLLVVALATVLLAAQWRWRAEHGALDLDGWVLAPTQTLLLVGIAATVLAVFRALDATSLALAVLAIAAALRWVRVTPSSPTPAPPGPPRVAIALVLIVVAGAALRMLPHDYALAGRDQGTYTLRAEHIARTGGLDVYDPLLRRASRAVKRRAGPGDILGLLPTSGERWRKDQYEGAYRPGLYLADRRLGHVVPQLFHLQPILLACGRLALGDIGPPTIIMAVAVLGLMALGAVAGRLWPQGPWRLLPVALLAGAPLVIWVQRSALSEGPALLLLWSAVLAALRARDGDRSGLALAALLVGGSAWVRGHGLLTAPLVGVALWALPGHARKTAAIYIALVLAALFIHASTVFPYLHDEIARMVPDVHPRPAHLVAIAIAAALAWDGVHRLLGLRQPRWATLWPSRAGLAFAVALATAILAWLWLRAGAPPKPFARLDPVVVLVGPAVLLAGAIGIGLCARTRLPRSPAEVWLAAIGTAMVLPIVLYARRNLPQGGLYYYGRYLVPELWPLLALGCGDALRRLHVRLARTRTQRTATAGSLALVAVLVGSTSLPLLTDPATRIREFAGARPFVAAVAESIPPGAIVIAGGEGWHHGHTFNQVGGALLLTHGITVLPYRSREATYATLHELLVEAPQPERPVFLLINEATKPYRLRDADGKPTGTKLAAFDEMLDGPFSATDVRLLEMFVHRLTPVTDTLPTRVTRDELRMALMRVEVDPDLLAAVERFAPPGGSDPRCLHPKKKRKFKLPKKGAAGKGPVSLVIVASPRTSRSNETWKIYADGKRLRLKRAGYPGRPRDTLGPFILSKRPKTLKIKGAKRRHRKAPCPFGGVDEI
ncbi:MAG: hypothetical protein AAF721_35115, partial [Myxococcota bacterium]